MTTHPVEKLTMSDGRQVALHRIQEGTGGRTVVLCHPAPGSASFDPVPEVTWNRGVTLLAVDRPGYGHSDPRQHGAWTTVALAADDIAEVLDSQASGPVGVAGWSAGGRVAMALAARRPDLVDQLVVSGTPAPHEHVPWIPDEIQQGLEALRGLPPDAVHDAIGSQFQEMLPVDAGSDMALGLIGASPADAEALDLPGARERLSAMLENAFSQGVAGLASDIAGFSLQPWGFEPTDVAAKTLLIYGAADPVTGNRHAQWWQRALRDARVEMTPGVGHLAILLRWERALSHLAPHSKREG